MTPTKPQTRNWISSLVALALLSAAVIPFVPGMGARLGGASLHAPNWALWAALPTAFQIHIIAASSALVIGTVLLCRPKGRGLHKALGWTWVAAMAITAISSLFMTGLNGGFYSIIHILSGWTLVAMPMAIAAIRSGKVEKHRRAMTGMFVGGLLVAGSLTFLPGRFMFEFFFG